MSSPRLRLSQSHRIRLGPDFARLRTQGQRLACGCLVLNWQLLPADSQSRLGVITSKKIGNAVKRARARRLLRESFRLHQFDFVQPVDVILVARNSIADKKFAEVEKDFLEALRRGRLLQNKP